MDIVKNFNDKVVSEVRKDEQRCLYEEGNIDAARFVVAVLTYVNNKSSV